MPSLWFGAELDRVRVWSRAQDIRIYININVNISKFRYIYQKIHSTNKNNLFNCDEDSNIFLQLYIVVHYYIFSTIHPLNIFSIYILYLSKLLHFSILSTNKIYLFFLYFFYVHTLIHTLLLTYSTASTSTMTRTSTSISMVRTSRTTSVWSWPGRGARARRASRRGRRMSLRRGAGRR